MGVSKNSGTPKSFILIGFSIIFTIHFGGPPLFLEAPHIAEVVSRPNLSTIHESHRISALVILSMFGGERCQRVEMSVPGDSTIRDLFIPDRCWLEVVRSDSPFQKVTFLKPSQKGHVS